VIWSDGPSITSEDMRDSLLPTANDRASDILNRPLGKDLNLQDLITEVARHYLNRAMDEAHGNKTRAAELVSLPSYQTLTNWLSKYGVKA
jgi:DNA-binding NtrC family response regulator